MTSFGSRRRKTKSCRVTTPAAECVCSVQQICFSKLEPPTCSQIKVTSVGTSFDCISVVTTLRVFRFVGLRATPVRCVVISSQNNSPPSSSPAANSRTLFYTRSGFPRCAQRRASSPSPLTHCTESNIFSGDVE
jgi:hypothetical protein